MSKSWKLVEGLFERTIKSVCSQTSNQFRVIAVCHEKPKVEFEHANLTYLPVDFPIPDSVEVQRVDRRRKHLAGLLHAAKFNPTHTMYVDADDCVSKHLANFVSSYPDNYGWFFRQGYVYPEGEKVLYLNRKNFHEWCGTSNIIRYDLHKLPPSTDDDFIDYSYYHNSHKHIVEIMLKQGTPLLPLPFIGSIYSVMHSDNNRNFRKIIFPDHIAFRFKACLFNYRPLTAKFRSEFGLYSVSAE
ncbi:glycosyltransferase family 2 protein [Halomicronema hongdechloris]|uniref:glycosyltransferase family 2 protein n=1 Tax=Halomicronema hongdechloris TaxID=1209493 RepID=UPI001930F30C|nr:glycosyltransferase family 2 protein [Halomicronema hongdechloris]